MLQLVKQLILVGRVFIGNNTEYVGRCFHHRGRCMKNRLLWPALAAVVLDCRAFALIIQVDNVEDCLDCTVTELCRTHDIIVVAAVPRNLLGLCARVR